MTRISPVRPFPLLKLLLAVLPLYLAIIPLHAQDQPAVISNVRVEPNPFSPNLDGVNESTKFTFTLSEAAKVSLEILYFGASLKVGGETIYEGVPNDSILIGSVWRKFTSDTIPKNPTDLTKTRLIDGVAGVNEFVWDGKARRKFSGVLGELKLLPDSTYTYLIRVEDLDSDDQFKSTPVAGTVIIDSKPPTITNISASPNPFSPDNDKISDQTEVAFTLGGLPSGYHVGTVVFKIVTPAEGDKYLDIDQGNTSPSGLYLNNVNVPISNGPAGLLLVSRTNVTADFRFYITGGRILDSGDTVQVTSADIAIGADEMYRVPEKFSFITKIVPYTTGTIGSLDRYTLDIYTYTGAGVKVDVFNSENQRVSTTSTMDQPFVGNGNYTTLFPPEDNTTIPDGTYTFVITAVDESGNQTQQSGSVTALSTNLTVTGLTVDPDTLSPANSDGTADVAAVTYAISRDAQVTIKVYRDSTVFNSSNLVKTLATSSPLAAGSQNVAWDGKDGAGAYVSSGAEKSYRMIITAFDPVSSQTSEARALIFIDNRKPAEVAMNKLPAAVNTPALTITGRTEPGSSVELFLNGTFADSVRANAITGVFSSARVQLSKQGLNLITARAFDAVRNGPTLSDTVEVLYDNRAPVITDTLIYVQGTAQRLTGRVLISYGPADTIELRLSDGSGRVSGLDLGRSAIQVTSPANQDVEGKTIAIQPNRLRFVPKTASTIPGSYNLNVPVYDSLGNTAQYTVAFSLGQASSGPSIQSYSMVNAAAPAGYINFSQAQPWAFTVAVTDNSGSGLNPNASILELYSIPGSRRLDGTTAYITPGTFTFTTAGAVATDGSQDGRYELRVVIEDNDASSGGLDQRLSFLYDSRAPDTLVFTASSSRIAATLRDRAGGSGVSLLQPLRSSMTVTAAGGGAALTAVEYTNDGDSTLIASFSPALPSGIYTAAVTMYDKAGNTRTRTLSFAVGGPGLQPTVTAPGAPFGSSVNSQAFTQPLTVGMTAADNSGAGIDWTATTARLYAPDSSLVPGAVNHAGDVLGFQAGRLLSSSGSDDGRWRLAVHVADLMSATADLDTVFSFLLDNRAPDTLAVIFAADTSAIYIDLTDPPAVAGRETSGVNILGATAAVTGPEGGVTTAVSHDGAGRLTVRFASGKPGAPGVYVLSVTAADKAGNQAGITRSFSLNVTGQVEVFPPDSTIVRGQLAGVWAYVHGVGTAFTPGGDASLRVNYKGIPMAGKQSVSGDSLYYRFNDTLEVDGSDDGRYEILADMDVPELAGNASTRTIFTVDNRAPDTSEVEVNLSASQVRVTASFTDHGEYPDVAGIDRPFTSLVIEDPNGREITPVSKTWLSSGALEAEFGGLDAAGLHRLRLTITDRAGWSTVRRKPIVNSFGQSAGQSTAFVEEVPARTSAHISFVSGHAGARINRAVLRIFNLRGDLVRRVDVSDRIDGSGSAVSAEWLLQNDRGDLVMNGVFIYAWEIGYDDGRREEIRKTLAVARR